MNVNKKDVYNIEGMTKRQIKMLSWAAHEFLTHTEYTVTYGEMEDMKLIDTSLKAILRDK